MQSNGRDKAGSGLGEEQTLSRLAAIGKISAGIAHEIRNPLTAVKGFLQLLQEEHPHRYLEVASSELDRAILTLQNLLQVSKPDLDDEPVQAVYLCAEMESILYLFQEQLYRVKVDKQFQDEDQSIYVKRNQFKKVFFNLLKNAFEAIRGEGTVTIVHRREGNHLRISIQDTGVGIAEEDLRLLGTPFFSTKEQGTGMGLTQVYSTVYEHGGRIEVHSELGRGTEFTLELPLYPVAPIGGENLSLEYEDGQTFQAFAEANWASFEDHFRAQAPHSFRYIEENDWTPDGLFRLIHELFTSIVTGNKHELNRHGKEFGKSAAKQDHPLVLILELTEAFRTTLWDFLYQYHVNHPLSADEVFHLQRQYNGMLDAYLSQYYIAYIDYKNEILRSHREAIDDLSVPVIPLSDTQAILPLVGTIDTHRAKTIQEKTLQQISQLRLEHIVIDVSAVAFLDTAVVGHLFRIIEGIGLLGCEATITGIRPEIANAMISLGISLSGKVETKATLQQALESRLLKRSPDLP
ncbi:MAG: STAS domain-containing protein [Alicyclobacillus sp.]|nr:STAS domain-containing protein [Alicyclobacillus sp.]